MGFRRARMLANLTQEDAARSLNVSRSTISMWETGESMPRADKLGALAKLYGCTVDDLLDDDQTEERGKQGWGE